MATHRKKENLMKKASIMPNVLTDQKTKKRR
jgi:hypothetical protein